MLKGTAFLCLIGFRDLVLGVRNCVLLLNLKPKTQNLKPKFTTFAQWNKEQNLAQLENLV